MNDPTLPQSASRNSLRLLFSAYPLLPVNEDSCGGAEQALLTLESELSRRGHDTVIAAAEGSRAAGAVLSTGAPAEKPDALAERLAEHTQRLRQHLAKLQADTATAFDLLHDHGGDLWQHASTLDMPVLATLHLPRHFYPQDAFQAVAQNVFFNCVSESQRRTFAGVPQVAGVVHNGVRVADFFYREQKQDYLLWLGRICEEKGTHIAIRIARAAGMKLIIAGAVYPFSYHQEYFEREVRPHLSSSVQYLPMPAKRQKLELLSGARALLVPSLVDETSSLVAMEAMACGTPVVAFRRGALPEIIAEQTTGFLAASEEEMIAAVRRTSDLSPRACRSHVEQHFSSQRMAAEYVKLYANVLSRRQQRTSRHTAA